MDNQPTDNGLVTGMWGPHMWKSLHSITFCYPINPNDIDKGNYKKFFELIGEVLPCMHCRESYKKIIVGEKYNNAILNDHVFDNRESLTKWLYYVHEAVNNELGINYHKSYEDVVRHYESFRSSCNNNSEKCVGKIKKYKLVK